MNIVKNIICLDENKASVIRLISKELEFVKKDGEVDFPIMTDFWNWWKKVVSYVEGDPVDICFVYDKNYDLINECDVYEKNIINSEESIWKVEHIKSYFWNLKPTYLNLMIVGPHNQEYFIGGEGNAIPRRFYTNLEFKPVNVGNKKKNSNTVEIKEEGKERPQSDNEYSEFAKYFVDLIRRERG